jgi:hypothetical protein
MVGQRPTLGGAVGWRPEGGLRDLEPEVYAQLRRDLEESLRSADWVGIPDLTQCLFGPTDCITVASACIDARLDPERLAVGGWHLHLALEATGEIQRLLPHVTGVIGPVDPRDMAPLAAREDVQWLSIPGEVFYYDYDSPAASHWDDRYAEIMAHDFAPGQLWLVGAGTLGKMYCGAIRAAGGVAIDVGALFDLWAGRADTRGEMRQHPWLAVPYLRG